MSSGNKHKNNPLVSAETVGHSSTYIILYVLLQHGLGLFYWQRLHVVKAALELGKNNHIHIKQCDY